MNPKRLMLALLVAGLTLFAAACNSFPAAVQTRLAPIIVEDLVLEVLSVRPHDTNSYTQGLLLYEGLFYESAGLNGESNLRQVDPETGKVLRRVNVPAKYFAEGLALVDNRLIQITWHEKTAFVYDLKTFKQLGTFSYEGEGWGLCYDGQSLYMSDGSDIITQRDPKTFAATGQIHVVLNGQPVIQLNELECVGASIYSNVWHTDNIMRIDKATGRVTATIDAAGLLTPSEKEAAGSEGVLNGIAYDPKTTHFLITGKFWPKLFEVRFVPRTKK